MSASASSPSSGGDARVYTSTPPPRGKLLSSPVATLDKENHTQHSARAQSPHFGTLSSMQQYSRRLSPLQQQQSGPGSTSSSINNVTAAVQHQLQRSSIGSPVPPPSQFLPISGDYESLSSSARGTFQTPPSKELLWWQSSTLSSSQQHAKEVFSRSGTPLTATSTPHSEDDELKAQQHSNLFHASDNRQVVDPVSWTLLQQHDHHFQQQTATTPHGRNGHAQGSTASPDGFSSPSSASTSPLCIVQEIAPPPQATRPRPQRLSPPRV